MGRRLTFTICILQVATLALADKSPLSKLYSNTTYTEVRDANVDVPKESHKDELTKRGLVMSAGVTYLASAVSNAFLSFAHSGATVAGTVINDSPNFLLYEGCESRHGHLTDVPGSLKAGQSTTFKGYVKFNGNPLGTPITQQNVWFKCTYKTKAEKDGNAKSLKVIFMIFVHLDAFSDNPNKLAIEVCEPNSSEGCADSFDALDDETSYTENWASIVKRKYSTDAGYKYSPCNLCRHGLNLCARGVMGSGQKTSVTIVIEADERHNFNYYDGKYNGIF